MNLSERVKIILTEQKLNQRQFSSELGVTESYISAIVNGKVLNISHPLASLIEEKYGYHAKWILQGIAPKIKQLSKNRNLSDTHQKLLMKVEDIGEAQAKAILAFIKYLEETEDDES